MEKKFKTYEAIRKSGLTNMFAVSVVCELSGGILTRDDCLYIMKHYAELYEKHIGDLNARG